MMKNYGFRMKINAFFTIFCNFYVLFFRDFRDFRDFSCLCVFDAFSVCIWDFFASDFRDFFVKIRDFSRFFTFFCKIFCNLFAKFHAVLTRSRHVIGDGPEITLI